MRAWHSKPQKYRDQFGVVGSHLTIGQFAAPCKHRPSPKMPAQAMVIRPKDVLGWLRNLMK